MSLQKKDQKEQDQKKQATERKLLNTLSEKDLQMIVGGNLKSDDEIWNNICWAGCNW